jgi:hypothetical protein
MTDTHTPPADLFAALHQLVVQRDEAAEAFDVFKQDAVMAHEPEAGQTPLIDSNVAADVAADEVDGFNGQIRSLLQSASDDALVAAYDRTDGEVGNLEAELLIDELKRRGIER